MFATVGMEGFQPVSICILYISYLSNTEVAYRVPELGNWNSCGTQVFSFVSHLLGHFILEIGNIVDSKDRSFN